MRCWLKKRKIEIGDGMSNNLQPHIRCGREEAVKYAILPGDPKRVERAGQYLTDVRDIAFNREYKSIIGKYKGVSVLVMSTGMGGASVGIAVEELCNIGVETMIRIGSCGALQENIHLGELILVNGAVRDEGTSKTYIDEIYPAIPDTDILSSAMNVLQKSEFPFHVGIIRSHDSFYTNREEEICRYWSEKGVLGADMETAALFTIGKLRGVRTASILNTVTEYQGDLQEDVNQYIDEDGIMMEGEKREILTAFETCVDMEKKIGELYK